MASAREACESTPETWGKETLLSAMNEGLGLHIAFRAAELHGFSLKLQPSEHRGLEVTLSSA